MVCAVNISSSNYLRTDFKVLIIFELSFCEKLCKYMNYCNVSYFISDNDYGYLLFANSC
jgi:hypothetical protein